MIKPALVFGYLITIIFGTIIHEMGHYLVAHFLNASPELHYGSCDWTPIESAKIDVQTVYFTLGGILLPNLIASIAVIILYTSSSLNNTLTNVLIIIGSLSFRSFFIFGTFLYAAVSNTQFETDETILNGLWSLPSGTVETIFVLFSSAIGFLLIRPILKTQFTLKTYGISMALGIFLGFFTWFKWLGPLLLP